MNIESREIINNWTLYTLTNDHNMSVSLLDFGGIITNISVPNRNKKVENVVLGYKNISDYVDNPNYLGAIVGRVAGRIQNASFILDGKTHTLETNEGVHHIHGGSVGFHQVIWTAHPFQTAETVGVRLTHTSPDGEGGYPGNLEVSVTYTLTNKNELILDYSATTDKSTALSLTNHSYFNLSGDLAETIHNHHVTIDSDEFIELDKDLIPTGKKIHVANTPFDLRSGRYLADGISSTSNQNLIANHGYDHYFIFNQKGQKNVEVKEETSGRIMSIKSNQPGLVMYTANTLNEGIELAEGYSKPYLGVCFETQASPASLHHEGFPTVVLNADEIYEKQTVFSFSSEA
ncbi:aldose epimerase family protein [Sporosarcina sp. G11-34]|uniref:aldose epimerase family protein n=1 Tax=Sporosarcina sp. G11-34 TaxID=2849605 RepID=UPI0022A9C466|nr:aldose epimerase family protein [Sporosarcina sp. G11-34]MCZ2258478.1 galactose mutarotase [Sporosarcina sp. G11-34]